MNSTIEQAKGQVIAYYQSFIDKCLDVHGIDLHTIISDCVTSGYNQAIDDVNNLIENHDEEVYVGVINDILELKKNTIK